MAKAHSMTPKLRFIFWLMSVTVACSLGFLVGHKQPGPSTDPMEVLAKFDQHPVTRQDVEKLLPAFLSRAAAEVVLNRLVNAEAFRRKIKVEGKELAWPRHIRTKADYEALGPRLNAEVSVRKLILSDWPEERLRRVYSLFQDELAQYDVSFTEILRADDVSAAQSDLEGEVEYGSLGPRYATDETGRLHQWRRWYSGAELEESFGSAMAAMLVELKPRTCTKPVRIGSQYFVFNLFKVRKSFDDLRPMLEQRAVDARRSALLIELLGKVKLDVAGPLGDDPKILEFEI